jgi:queuine tRNA-ribosyltransferase
MTGRFSFELVETDPACAARTAIYNTPHGTVDLPAFMPVGTQGTVKGLTVDGLAATGTQMMLANTYHLALRPGAEVVAALGGLHAFSGWNGPILTDSGGFQIFSLAHNTQVSEDEVTFRSHVDGNLFSLSPERAVAIQEQLASDVAMVLDHVVPLPCEIAAVRDATERTIRWAGRSLAARTRDDQALFAIVQGGLDPDLRTRCAQALVALDFPGYAVGGLSVGESPAEMYRVLDVTVPALPADRPRYLMGVGRPQDLLEAIRRGIDLFDCVLPTRNGRNAMAFSDDGPIRLRNAKYERDPRPLEEGCACAACRLSRGYLRHLFLAGEMLGPVLVTLHNLTYYQRLMREAREAIREHRFVEFAAGKGRRLANLGDSRD